MQTLNNEMVIPFTDELESQWLLKGHRENRLKSYLSYVGSLMLREPATYDILSDRKLAKISAREHSVETMDDVVRGERAHKPRRAKSTSAFSVVQKIRRKYPKGNFHFVIIDTDGVFKYNDRCFRMSDAVEAYASKQTASGVLYDMDHVVILDCGCLHFFDQKFREIPRQQIEFL